MKYLLVTYIRTPGGQIDEQVGFSKRLRPNDIQTCNVILNYETRRVEKCVIEGKARDNSFDNLHNYYKQHYPNHIKQLEDMNRKPEQVIQETTEEKTDGQ